MHYLEALVANLAHSLPLELFVILGSFLEEVVAPIPSPSIMVIAGSFGAVQGYTHTDLATLVILASIGKTLGGVVMYYIAHTVKEAAVPRFGKYIGVTMEDIERFGNRFTGTVHDYMVYIFFRSVPIIPSILLSFGSGILKLPLKLFIIGTFVGTVVRDTFYIIVGYEGTAVLGKYLANTSATESFIEVLAAVVVASVILFLFIRHRRKN